MDADRKKQLTDFVSYAKTLDGDEKGEAQVFLDRLFRAFSRSGYKEAGAKLEERVQNERGGTSFADLVWKPGLRALYRTLELPGANPLKDAHEALNATVLDAYGFDAQKDILKQLLDLNLAVANAIDKGEDVTAPGVPKSFGDPAEGGLITDDCIQP